MRVRFERRARRGAQRARLHVAVVLLGAMLATSVACVQAEVAETEEDDFARRLARAFDALEARRLDVIVAVAHGDSSLVVREVGLPARDALPGARTLVDLNSITKTFTGVMAAALVERGELAFDTTLAEVFPEVPADKAGISLHQLLTHTAGLPEAIGDDFVSIERADFVREVFRTPLVAQPGATYAYSNTGYGLIAAMLEVRAGLPYELCLRNTVLSGLSLRDTGYAAAYDDLRSLRAADGSSIERASWGGHAPGWHLIGNGGLISTMQDFVTFRRAFTEGRLVSARMRDVVQTPHVREDGSESFYGYGVVVQDVPGLGRVYSHDGGNDVFSAHWVDLADRGDLVVIAGVDGRRGNAIDAMEIFVKRLYADARQ